MNRNSHEECQKKINRLYTANQNLAKENSKIFKLLETSENKIKTLARALENLHKEFRSSSIVMYDRGLEKRIVQAEKEIGNEKI